MKKIIQFIKYNNAFVIIFGLIFTVSGGVFANETSRDAIIGKTIITRIGVDNSQIVGANLSGFNMDFKIVKIMEDERGYNVSYSYNTIYIKDNVWQPLIKEGEMYVTKSGLGDKDLGLYVAEELGQKADSEIAYLKEVQSIEKSKGIQNQTESVEYTGLKGLVFDSEKGKIVGYKPVKDEAEKDKMTTIDAAALTIKAIDNKEENKPEKGGEEKSIQQITVVKEMVSKETIMQMVKEAMAQEQGGGASASSSSSSSAVSGGGAGTQTSPEASSSSSSALSSESSSASSTSDVLPSQSLPAGEAGSSSTSDVIPVASSSSESSSAASSESSTSSISPISESSSSSEPTSDVGSSSSESSSSSSAEAVSSAASSEAVSSSSSSESSSASSDLSAGEAEPAP